MYGLSVRVGVAKPWPNSYISNEGYPLHLAPRVRLLKVYQLMADSLNFTSSFVEPNQRKTVEESLKHNNLIMVLSDTLGDYRGTVSKNSYLYDFKKIVVFVPIIQETKLKASMEILYTFSSIVAMILTILLFFKFSRDENQGWSFLIIFGLMLGNALNFQPRSIKSKIVYFILLMFSILFISDQYLT